MEAPGSWRSYFFEAKLLGSITQARNQDFMWGLQTRPKRPNYRNVFLIVRSVYLGK